MWFRLKYGATGTLLSCEPIEKPEAFATAAGPALIVEIEADSETDAKRRAYNFYCSRKKKLAKKRNHEAGNCACSRKQDRINPQTGKYFLTCSVCAERQDQAQERCDARKRAGVTGHQRDEAARVETLKGRVRERKNEIRLEVLLEVRTKFENCQTVSQFKQWLRTQIDASLVPRKAS